MSTEIICALIATAGIVISSLASWRVSRAAVNTEVKKLELTWKREDVVTSDDEFAEMAAAVSEFLSNNYAKAHHAALGKVGAVRSRESGELGESLDVLHAAMKAYSHAPIEAALTEVIEQKRKAKS